MAFGTEWHAGVTLDSLVSSGRRGTSGSGTIAAMPGPFIGSEAVAAGEVTKSALRTRYDRLFRDVYVAPGTELTPSILATAGWLWSRRNAVVAGRSAAALHGARWVDLTPVELLHGNRNPVQGVKVHTDEVGSGETTLIDGVPTTTVVRTALDLACWYPINTAVIALDALVNATGLSLSAVDALVAGQPGRRGIRRARKSLAMVDGGSQSPKETWLRLLVVSAGLPRPQTQIPIHDGQGNVFAYLDMGWEDIRVAVEYDGEQHRNQRDQYIWDIRRREMLDDAGWLVIRVVAGDKASHVVSRVRSAFARRVSPQRVVRRAV